jgi:kinesin family protein 15
MAPIRFVLDGVLDANCDQEAAYARVGADAIEELLRGQSRSLIACGAAGAGKTYSLFGSPELLANPSSDAWKGWGLLPRTGHHLFARANAVGGLEALCGPGGSVKCSFLEIFDERVNDLLGKGRNLRVRESAAHGVYVPEAVHRLIEWEEDVMRALVLGLQNRTLALPYSSNGAAPGLGFSHTIFTLTVSMRTSEGELKESRLQLVDLGSPETLRPGVSAGHKLSSPAHRSLAALSSCITAQADGSGQGVPYRDSKLTWLLRDALGGNNVPAGNARLSILAACELRQEALPATMATLRFAQRCRHARMWIAAAIDPRHPVTGILPLPLQRGGAQGAVPPVAHLATDVSPPMRMTASQTLSLQRGPASESDSEDGLEGMPSVAAAGRRLNFSDAGGSAAHFANAQADATHAHVPAMDPRATSGDMESTEGWGQLVEAHEHMLQLETKLELARSTSVDAMRANSPGLVASA